MKTESLVRGLTELGFSSYEARAYVGLVKHGSATGYGLANATGVPEPKVYEALHRLAKRGIAVQISQDPARYSALPAEQLVGRLKAEFEQQVSAAQQDLNDLWGNGKEAIWHEPLIRIEGLDLILTEARKLVEQADQRLYISGWPGQLATMRGPILDAESRGVLISVLHFGAIDFDLERGQVIRHATTEGVLYPRHRSRQLAVVADSSQALWALAPDGDDWSAAMPRDGLLVSVIKAFVRHDICVQRIYQQLADEMHALFGPGLELLNDLSSDEAMGQLGGRREAS